jgi:hypothetical protein
MAPALFINKDEAFNKRITLEANSQAIIASSLDQGAKLVLNPNTQIKAIYLNPNDASYSALQFLELSLLHRPATPVFLIDSEGELSSDAQKAFFEQHHIQGFFNGNESFQEYQSKSHHSNFAKAPDSLTRESKQSQHTGYIAVPIIDFLHTADFLFDVFLEADSGKLSLFATSGSPVEPEYLNKSMEQASWFYVNETAIKEIREKIRKTQNEMTFSSSFPISWKTAETLYKAKTLLNDLRSSGLSDASVNSSHEILGEVFHVVSQLQTIQTSEKLSKFISQAKDSDRNIACATLSILMCKSLKFEKNAIVEILGLASLFQDIAVYNSPFGNLSEINPKDMSPEAHAYYLKHPTLSADLLAQTTSIPDVTLQVIRQHHERKDRTGFPGKVGGMQLHPMAEILSIINEFMDHDPQTLEAENEIYRHFSDRIVVAYKQIHIRVKGESANISSHHRNAA